MPLLEVLEVGSFRCLEGVHRVEVFRGDLEPGLKGVFGLDTTKTGGRTDTRKEPCPQLPVESPIVK